jgi:predicted metal-dependent hydrolase
VERVVVQFDHWSFKLTVPSTLDGSERAAATRKAIRKWYEKRAVERMRSRVEKWVRTIGASPARVLTRDQRSRWGSCSPNGTLRFNWRIVMAEPALIDYVVVHELAHLVVRTHSAEFWQQVARVMPDYKLRRARLKAIGPELSL